MNPEIKIPNVFYLRIFYFCLKSDTGSYESKSNKLNKVKIPKSITDYPIC